MYFFFPAGEEINALTAKRYYEAHNIFAVLHPVSHLEEYIRDIHTDDPGSGVFLWNSHQTTALVYSARKQMGYPVASPPPGTPTRSVLSRLLGTPGALLGYFTGTASSEGGTRSTSRPRPALPRWHPAPGNKFLQVMHDLPRALVLRGNRRLPRVTPGRPRGQIMQL